MQGQGFFMDLLREFVFFPIDQLVYSLIELFYDLFSFVSELAIFNDGDFRNFTTKVYLVLGVFMLFKLAFTLISLFANPDNLMDSQKGVSGIVKRIIISLILITFVPTIFNLGYQLQTIIIKDNIIGNFFLGNLQADDGKTGTSVVDFQNKAGKMVSFNVFSAFFYPEDFVLEEKRYNDKGEIQFKDGGGKANKWSSDAKLCVTPGPTGCADFKTNEDLYNYIRLESYDMSQLGKFVKKDKKDPDDGGKYYVMHYTFLISTVAGVIVAWIFFGFCFDAAIRVVKLGVLQLIAPIPIFSYIDPKKGDSIFKNWIKTTLSTYGSLLGRLALIYFVLYVLYILQEHGIQQFTFDSSGNIGYDIMDTKDSLYPFAVMLVYIGLLLFAKDAPKLFADMFGIKMEGSFGSKLSKMGMAATGLAVGVGTAKYLGNKYNRFMTKAKNREEMDRLEKEGNAFNSDGSMKEEYAKLHQENKWRTGLMQSGKSVWHGATAGAIGGWKAKKISMGGFKSGVSAANAVQLRRADKVSFGNETQEKIGRFFGYSNEYGSFGKWKKELKEAKNDEQKLAIQENRMREHYSDLIAGLTQKYSISADNVTKLSTGDTSGVNDLIEEKTKDLRKKRENLQLDFINKDFSKMTDEDALKIKYDFASELGKLNREISTIEKDFNGIVNTADVVNKLDAKHQSAVKKVSKLQNNINSLDGKK